MFMATVQLLFASIESLITHETDLDVSFTTLAILATTILLKSALYIYCRTVKSSSAQALAMDHRNDVITNSFGIVSVFLSLISISLLNSLELSFSLELPLSLS